MVGDLGQRVRVGGAHGERVERGTLHAGPAPQLRRPVPGQGLEPGLDSGVDERPGGHGPRRPGRDVDDAAAGPEARQQRLDEQHGRLEVGREHARQVGPVDVVHEPSLGHGGVLHQDVDRAAEVAVDGPHDARDELLGVAATPAIWGASWAEPLYRVSISSLGDDMFFSVNSLEHVAKTLAPRAARWNAMPRPMPLDAPLRIFIS